MKRIVSGMMFILLLAGMLTLAFNIQPVKAWTGTVYIRADGSIDPPSAPIQRDGDIYTLTDNITSSGNARAILVRRDDIIIDGAGYTVQGSGSGIGIYLLGRKNVTVRNTQIQNFNYGIYLGYSSNNTVIGNNITANGRDGIYLDSSSNNSVIRNNITANNWSGIYLFSSFNNTAVGNNITNNDYGIHLGSYSSNNTVIGNDITNNNRYGIWLYSSSTSNNSVIRNNITANGRDGIELSSSSNNSIIGNYITNTNKGNGIWLGYSSNNTVIGNNITNNRYGVYLDDSSNNVFCHNNFINNTYRVSTSNSANVWDLGYPSGGNYWSDYVVTANDTYSGSFQDETGSDGMSDEPYVIDANNTDHYPLMGMFSDFNATSEHHVRTICNSTISDFQFNGTAISFNASGENGTTGFCRICVPTTLMNDTYKVFVNGTEVPHTLLPCSNSTHSYLYFTYNHSTQEVVVIPEFSTWTSMLLVLIVLTFAIVIYKRRLLKTLPNKGNKSSHDYKVA